jgi:GNAT superfamily N-acetyltransferase
MQEFNLVVNSEDHLKSIQKLYFDCFKTKITENYLIKKYDTNKFGESYVGYLAFYNNEIAGYYGVFPLKILINGKIHLVAQSGDTMTHPNYQKKGLFTALALKTYELAKSKNLSFIFGFPNENSYKGFKDKLNWKFVGNLKKIEIINSTLPFSEIANKNKILRNLHNIYCKIKLAKFIIEVNEKSISNFQLSLNSILRDTDFFNYKLRNPNVYFINFNNFNIMISLKGHLYIGDVGKFEIANINKFLETVRILGKMLLCRRTVFTMSENHWIYKSLHNLANSKDSLPIGFLNLKIELFNFDTFCFSQLDFDTF